LPTPRANFTRVKCFLCKPKKSFSLSLSLSLSLSFLLSFIHSLTFYSEQGFIILAPGVGIVIKNWEKVAELQNLSEYFFSLSLRGVKHQELLQPLFFSISLSHFLTLSLSPVLCSQRDFNLFLLCNIYYQRRERRLEWRNWEGIDKKFFKIFLRLISN